MDFSNLPETVLQTALKILTIFVGLFGSTVTGLLAYFFSRMIRKQETMNEKLIDGQNELKKEFTDYILKSSLEFKDMEMSIEYLKMKIDQGRSFRSRKTAENKRASRSERP